MTYTEEQKAALRSCPLFAGLEEKSILTFLSRAMASPVAAGKDEHVLEQGDRQEGIHIILTGRARGERFTADGRAQTVNEFGPGELFGEILSGADMDSPVTVRMLENGSFLRISLARLISALGEDSAAGERVLRNLIGQISEKYFHLMNRLEMILCPTLRGKIASYLLKHKKTDSNKVTVPHSREEQAAYLNCDRSALSRELSRLKKENIIDYSGKSFTILDIDKLKSME